eukprot:TRINITY_DN3522_c0_g2_i2.p1 TRINITY_DN3522_c0_g2~~TRINITY_DN3522_c0_g2_i2.p1  ORF type:complete len:174 (-),score=38.14 TRINITY_DN3522_c0_g2_i2:98-619(-)
MKYVIAVLFLITLFISYIDCGIHKTGFSRKLRSNLTCSERTTCDLCVGSLECVWCTTENTCVDGNPFGPSNNANCKNWKYKQCKLNQKLFLILLACAGGLALFLIIVISCYCYCKCRKRNNAPRRQYDLDSIENRPLIDNEPLDPKKEENRRKREDIRIKYNLKGNYSDSDNK